MSPSRLARLDAYYDSSDRGFPELGELVDLWRYRGLIWELMVRDIKVRYKRSVLGIAWTMIAPLLNMVALTLVFSTLLRQQIRNYPAFFMIGSMYWAMFATGTSFAATLTHDSNELAKRIYLPRSVFVVSAVGVALVNLVLSIVPLVVILIATRFHFHATSWFFPFAVVLLAAFTLGVAFFVFTLASRFTDIREMYLVLVQTWFFITPIVYAPSIVPARFRFVLWLNPHYFLLQTFRTPIYEGMFPPRKVMLFSAAIAFGVLAAGWSFFCRRIQDYAYRS
ncbi:MAG TPA: ABC transporter permease [Thermoanaerobaculia bacterium]|nr:ABC transporter permease [Thermoanaerobaculia bacterium]